MDVLDNANAIKHYTPNVRTEWIVVSTSDL